MFVSKVLTPREKSILKIIKQAILERGYPPSVREIGQQAGLRSSSTVHGYLKRLEEKKVIRRVPSKPRAIEVLDLYSGPHPAHLNWIPMLGHVAAGTPILAVENIESFFPLPKDFTGAGEFFMLTVKGDSMIDIGIFDHDQVIVKKQHTADNGDIVIALLDEEATVKRFFKRKNNIELKPENKNMDSIIAKDVVILGKVVGLLRKI